MNTQRTVLLMLALTIVGVCLVVSPARANPPSGAIFTTTATGSEVNANQYSAKEDVYLDGGPGPGAPATAAGLDDGTYVFQVTDPPGKTLLSTDNVECREFTVSGGIITGVTGPCPHVTGVDQDHNAVTVQLFPYNDTPNSGGVYKVWVTLIENYGLGGCSLSSTGADCAVGKFGFVPGNTKTDNFKVKAVPIREIDGFFIDQNTGQHLNGMQMTWFDTVGASNQKWSYYVAFYDVTEGHVEAVEDGTHQIVIDNQSGCTIGDVYLQEYTSTSGSFTYVGSGPQTVPIKISGNHYQNHILHVYCQP